MVVLGRSTRALHLVAIGAGGKCGWNYMYLLSWTPTAAGLGRAAPVYPPTPHQRHHHHRVWPSPGPFPQRVRPCITPIDRARVNLVWPPMAHGLAHQSMIPMVPAWLPANLAVDRTLEVHGPEPSLKNRQCIYFARNQTNRRGSRAQASADLQSRVSCVASTAWMLAL